MTTFTGLTNSTFLDAFGAGQVTAEQISTLAGSTSLATAQSVLGPLFGTGGTTQGTVSAVTSANDTVIVGLMVNRAEEPTSLLTADWATRQSALADQTAVWAQYGADAATYSATVAAIGQVVSAEALSTPQSLGYVSNEANRTIWLSLDATDFGNLFNTDLLLVAYTNQSGQDLAAPCWAGDLSLPDSIAANIAGVWVDAELVLPNPAVMNSQGIEPTAGPLSLGNSSSALVDATPAAIAANYNFPLGPDVPTDAIALIEAGLPNQTALLNSYNMYLQAVGLDPVTPDQLQVISGSDDSTTPSEEIAIDISVVGGAAPNSTQLLYAPPADASVFSAYQRVFFDFDNDPKVLTSSYGINFRPTPNSPFQVAYQQLFVDGMLSNVSVHNAAGDSGSNGYAANGVANIMPSTAPTYALVVGGTSIASITAAQSDHTLAGHLAKAMASDPSTIFDLVAAGLVTLPINLSTAAPPDPSPVLASLFESVWQQLSFEPDADLPGVLATIFGANQAGLGGVNTGIGVPWYQSNYGLQPTSSTGVGRGVPDVSALSAGDSRYAVLNIDNVTNSSASILTNSGGTSAAAPLWASLTAQFNAVFADQHLPALGFYNDLLYTAAAIAPASFNDILLGNNTASYFSDFSTPTGYFDLATGYYITPTGDGYEAGPGYDLATGLGTPNGLVLARALTAIAQTQTYNLAHSESHAVIDSTTSTSAVAQTLLVQSNFTSAVGGATKHVEVLGMDPVDMADNSTLGWTSRLAGQVVQGDNFDSALVTLLDGGAKSVPYEISVQAGVALGVSVDGHDLALYQELLTNDYGFLQFGDVHGGITLARPVAIAQTAGGASDQNAILRIRQNGGDDAQLEVYRVDDLNGTVNGYAPGQAGYAAQAAARDYQLVGGGTVIDGPGWGNFKQVEIAGVDQGDIVALKYTNVTTDEIYWAFSQGNSDNVTAIYNYGLNIWGFEDRPLLGDNDYQDVVVHLDFTSTAGQQLLA